MSISYFVIIYICISYHFVVLEDRTSLHGGIGSILLYSYRAMDSRIAHVGPSALQTERCLIISN